MKVGDLVRYRHAEFVTTRVHEEFIGLVVEKIPPQKQWRTIRVKWNTKQERFQVLWHDPEDLELVDAIG